jgi:hypothetical protein
MYHNVTAKPAVADFGLRNYQALSRQRLDKTTPMPRTMH